MCLERESIRVKSVITLGVLREGPYVQWSLSIGDKAAKTVLNTMIKASLEESRLCGSLSLRGRTICLNEDRLYRWPDPCILSLHDIVLIVLFLLTTY